MRVFQDFQLPLTPSGFASKEALCIALDHNRTVYDSLYIGLAMKLNTEMITADERLANALSGRFPVKWLGAFQQPDRRC